MNRGWLMHVFLLLCVAFVANAFADETKPTRDRQTPTLGQPSDPASPTDSDLPLAESSHERPQAAYDVETVTGRVGWYAEAVQRILGVTLVPEAAERVLAIETDDGHLFPLMEDLRTRAFRKDPRLRQMQVELLVRRYRATPALQVLKMFQLEGGQKFQLDYWCDICAIVMFETGSCACCQDDNRLRKQRVETR